MNANKVIHENLVFCEFLKVVNFSELTESNQIFRNDFVFIHYHLCKISAQIIECKTFAPYELSITLFTLWFCDRFKFHSLV